MGYQLTPFPISNKRVPMGRPEIGKFSLINLGAGVADQIDAIAGKGRRSAWIREAVSDALLECGEPQTPDPLAVLLEFEREQEAAARLTHKVGVRLPSDMVERIEALVGERNRSAFIRWAIGQRLMRGGERAPLAAGTGVRAIRLRLPEQLVEQIDKAAGGQSRRSDFIREAAEAELKRRGGKS